MMKRRQEQGGIQPTMGTDSDFVSVSASLPATSRNISGNKRQKEIKSDVDDNSEKKGGKSRKIEKKTVSKKVLTKAKAKPKSEKEEVFDEDASFVLPPRACISRGPKNVTYQVDSDSDDEFE